MSDARKRGAAATEGNKQNYAALIAELKATGRKFPANQFGEASIGWVAAQINCTRDVLREGSLAEQFKRDIADIGICANNAASENERLQKKYEGEKKENSTLQKIVSEKTAKIEALQQQVEKLTRLVRELENRRSEEELALEELLSSGRRFWL